MKAMTLTVYAFCVNCNSPEVLDKHGRCSTCGSDAVDYAAKVVSRWLSTGKLKAEVPNGKS